MIVAASHAHGSLTATESRLLANVIAFSDRQVAEIMTPRLSTICLFTNKTLGENIAIVREHQHTRYPLADGSIDKVIGIVHVKDLLLLRGLPQGEGGVLRSIMRPASFVPETASVDAALRLIQRRRSLMVIVVDEYGTVAGLVTLEDVLEEIVGPIQDEFDTPEPPGVQREGEDVEVDASMPLSEVAAKMRSLPIPDSDRVRTVGGYILKLLGHVPKVGETLTLGRYQVQVIEMDHLRIKRLRFRAQHGRGEQAAPRP
jgi:CBS domain containing-hemolysin-like protein